MKKWPLIFLFMTSLSHAEDCKVFGITDGPQKLDCSFKGLKVNLRCEKGEYYLNGKKVENAFHMEVESGTVPLVFEAQEMQLTVTLEPKVKSEAELERNGRIKRGTCL